MVFVGNCIIKMGFKNLSIFINAVLILKLEVMKTIIIFLACMIICVFTYGQIEEKKMPHVEVDEVQVIPPKFTGIQNPVPILEAGQKESIKEYLAKNIKYPDSKNYIQGTEVVQFNISTTGELSDFIIINGLSQEINDEVIRVLKSTNGMWIPGYNNGNVVAMEKEISVVFKVTGSTFDKDFTTLARKYFTKGSIVLFTKENPRRSIKSFDKGIKLLPNDENLLFMRGMARYEIGDKDGAYRDWERINALGGSISHEEYHANLKELKGYAELVQILNK